LIKLPQLKRGGVAFVFDAYDKLHFASFH
jgi:hypothetical protein